MLKFSCTNFHDNRCSDYNFTDKCEPRIFGGNERCRLSSLDDVYKYLFGLDWTGEDPLALGDRIGELLRAEKELWKLHKELRQLKAFFK